MSILYTKISVSFDIIPPELFKMAERVLFQPLPNSVNKVALTSPLDKGTSKKNDVSNFRQATFLTAFEKIYEKVTKKINRYCYEQIFISFHFCLLTKL